MRPAFAARSNRAELMDDPACDGERLRRTLKQFTSINRLVSRYRTILKRWVLDDMAANPDRAHHLLDMGAGGCDIDAWLLAEARRRGLKLRITACDLDPRTITYARSTFGHVAGLTILQADLLADPFDDPVDYVFANHFLHHLTDGEIIRLLRTWAPRTRRRMVFSDLLRDPWAYAGFSILSIVYRNSFARQDGLISIQRGFRPDELEALARSALPGRAGRVHRLMPGRLALCIGPDPAQPV